MYELPPASAGGNMDLNSALNRFNLSDRRFHKDIPGDFFKDMIKGKIGHRQCNRQAYKQQQGSDNIKEYSQNAKQKKFNPLDLD